MDIEKWYERHTRRIGKKYHDKGETIFVLHSRVFQSAYGIMRLINDVSIDELSLKLFMIVKDAQCEEFVRRYEYVLEMAKEKPDVFAEQLYSFYVTMASTIKKNNYYAQFFDFLSFFQSLELEDVDEKTDNIYNAYITLLLEQLEFLRANKFELNKLVVGLSTDGKVIEVNDVYPFSDFPSHEAFYTAITKGTYSFDAIRKMYAAHGYDVRNEDESELLRLTTQLYTNVVSFLTPYINEFNIDILPQDGFNPDFGQYGKNIPDVLRNSEDLKEKLTRRKRTLSVNGVKVHFENSKFINDILLKEVMYKGAIVCLYRIETKQGGETSGFYNTKTKQFASIFTHTIQKYNITEYVENTILWAYASYVCVGEDVQPTSQSYNEYLNDPKAEITFTPIGGKLRVPTELKHIRTIAGDERYQTEMTHINGYVRKLPDGQKASEKAKLLAQSLGYELDDNETYVQPFERTSWILKKE